MGRFDGVLTECLKDFAQKTKGNFPYRRRVAHVIGINPYALHVWLDKGKLPLGLNLLRLYLLLELNGYNIVETHRIHPKIRELGNMLAVGALQIDIAAKTLGFASTDGVLRVVLGKTGTTKMTEIEAILRHNEWKSVAQNKLHEWRNEVLFTEEQPQRVTPKITGAVQKTLFSCINHESALKIFAHQVLAMVPLAEWIASDEFTPDERRKLRELSSNGRSNNVFELSTALNRLCSETARKEMR